MIQENQKLNESTADFNKQIRKINQELIQEGKLDPDSGEIVTPRSKLQQEQSTTTL